VLECRRFSRRSCLRVLELQEQWRRTQSPNVWGAVYARLLIAADHHTRHSGEILGVMGLVICRDLQEGAVAGAPGSGTPGGGGMLPAAGSETGESLAVSCQFSRRSASSHSSHCKS
jgi:hypothetical protein